MVTGWVGDCDEVEQGRTMPNQALEIYVRPDRRGMLKRGQEPDGMPSYRCSVMRLLLQTIHGILEV